MFGNKSKESIKILLILFVEETFFTFVDGKSPLKKFQFALLYL